MLFSQELRSRGAALLKSSSVSVEAHKFGCFYGSHSVFELPCVFISLTKLPPHFLLFLFHVFSVVYTMWISAQVSWTEGVQIKELPCIL